MQLNTIPTTATSTTPATGSSSSSGAQSSTTSTTPTLGEDDFLKMLITELQNQDPTNPLQSTDLAAQLAQFSSVSELQSINTNLQNSTNANLVLTQSISNTMAATLIGKEIKANTSNIAFDGSTQPAIGVTLNSSAADVQVKIMNSNGTVVRTIDAGAKASGDNTITWDGTGDSGNKVQAGNYTFSVSAADAQGNAISLTSYVLGIVQGVKYTSNGTTLIVNGSEINLSDVQEIFGS